MRTPVLHNPQLVAKLLMTSRATACRVAAALAGRLQLCFGSCSTEAVLSLSLWLHQHAALLDTLEVCVNICCCSEDEAAADAALSGALSVAAALNPALRLTAFSTTYAKSQLLSPTFRGLPCLQHLVHLAVSDISTDAYISCLPPQLSTLEISKSTATSKQLQLIVKRCPKLRVVRIGYSLWPSKANAGSALLDAASGGWVLMPLVELRFIGCRLPR